MSRAKLLLAACFAMFAFSGIATSVASASEWQIEGEAFKAGETRPFLPTALVLAIGKLKVNTGTPIEVKCKGEQLKVKNGSIVFPDEVTVESVVFSECTTENTGGCKLSEENAESIGTVPVRGLAHLVGTLDVLVLLLPKTKTVFATIHFEGGTCALLGVQPVTEKGDGVHLFIHHGQVFKLLHLVLPLTLAGGLTVGGTSAELTEADWDIALNSHRLFRFL